MRKKNNLGGLRGDACPPYLRLEALNESQQMVQEVSFILI